MSDEKPALLGLLIAEQNHWGQVDLIPVAEDDMVNALALVADAVEALGVLNGPASALVADERMVARDPLIGNRDIVARQASDSHDALVQAVLRDDLAIDFDQDHRPPEIHIRFFVL